MSDSLDLALAKLSEMTAVGLAEIKGQLALLVHRAEHSERRTEEITVQADADRRASIERDEELERRLDVIEREAVTRPQLAARTKLLLTAVGVMVTATGVVIALLTFLNRT
ncbi:hypothetical protein SAMN05421505_16111 [Sinosporangium album]|uniref:Uncharacterized protein n=1 Tax=Sinosporangium album TaxID=504805 RepID=A0A1G8L4H9_9ACTN|nr:hypothetical protein [Sinosporangium album]SDI50579.1 hypothetical protein SAMN05421505_16111 [Sinosporangium album]